MNVSVVIPYYKNRAPLLHTLNSLTMQKFSDGWFEVIVVDDGSSDPELDAFFVSEYAARLTLHYYSYEKNQGASFARNFGSKHAKGELLIFLDSDQVLLPNFIQQHVNMYRHLPNNVPIVQIGLRNEIPCGLNNTKEVVETVTSCDSRFILFELYSENMQAIEGAWHLAFSHNISVKKSVIADFGSFNEVDFNGWGLEDCEFAYRLVQQGVKLVYNPNILTYHISHPLSWNNQAGFEAWRLNLNAFMTLHDEADVAAQKVFYDFFDPERRKKRLEKGVERPWVDCFKRFEKSLAVLNSVNKTQRQIFYLKDVSLSQLKQRLQAESESCFVIFISKVCVNIITFVQVMEEGKRVKLFTY